MICLLKTTVAGYIAGLLFDIIKKKNRYLAVFVASGLVPIINTALFVLGCLCMNNSIVLTQDWLVHTVGETQFFGLNPFVFILVGLVTFNFFVEFAINLIVAPGLHTVYNVVEKQFRRGRR
jgi:hypothetical protein